MGRKPAKVIDAKLAANTAAIVVNALPIKQGKHRLFAFVMSASSLWKIASISRRDENKDSGYQRALSSARTDAVVNYIKAGNPIPPSVVLSLNESVKWDATKGQLRIPKGNNVAWVVDGQHRLAGAHKASTEGYDIDISVVAYITKDEAFDIDQFITINREAKNVPTSLVYDLLKKLPTKRKPSDIAAERAAELASALKSDEESVFYNRIVVMSSPKDGQLSLTNFVRKIGPLVNVEKGLLNANTFEEQRKIISNFYSALRIVFPQQWSRTSNVFFKTVGFGAMFNVFDMVFKETTFRNEGSFEVASIVSTLKPIAHFDFSQWDNYGSGNKAEIEAGNDFRVDLTKALSEHTGTQRIKL